VRRPIVAANWKMNKTVAQATDVAAGIQRLTAKAIADVDVVVCPPFTALAAVGELLRGSSVALGAQNVHHERGGAFTGEVSLEMLADVGCSFVILGHSERRALFGETDEGVRRKAAATLEAGLTPIVCVGETLDEREADRTEQVVGQQIDRGLEGFGDEVARFVIAYEPVWAIGTGRTATPEQAQAAHAFIRGRIAERHGSAVAEAVRIQYGGSVKPSNASELFGRADVDGGLIGGASLEAESFAAVVEGATR
jgi:triosephosphate isomerase